MLKSELLNQAYAELRISGLTVNPTPEDTALAIFELDQMMWEWESRGIAINYNFPAFSNTNRVESDPDDPSHLPPFSFGGVIASLAMRLFPYFKSQNDGQGVSLSPLTLNKARSGLTAIKQQTFRDVKVCYPGRMPRGSANTLRAPGQYWRYYHPNYENSRNFTDITKNQVLNDSQDFGIFIEENDSIESFTINATGGVTVIDSCCDDKIINYRLKANNPSSEHSSHGQVDITVTTLCGLVIPKTFCYRVSANACITTTNY